MLTPGLKTLLAPALALGLMALTGCAKPSQAALPSPSVLNVPPPPPRVISVPPEPVAPVATTTVDPPAEPQPVRTTRQPSRTDTNRGTGQASTEPDPAPAVEAPAERPPEPAAAGALVLRTPQTADESQAVRRIRGVLDRATGLLAQVNAASLTREARTQHDTARRFVEQSQQALLERNFVFASYLADKAETLARGLSR